jgi:hypothetical protein
MKALKICLKVPNYLRLFTTMCNCVLRRGESTKCILAWPFTFISGPVKTQRSVLGPLPFSIYINDLPLDINKFAKGFLFADDTSVLVTGKNHSDLMHKVMSTLSLVVISLQVISWF